MNFGKTSRELESSELELTECFGNVVGEPGTCLLAAKGAAR